MKNKEDLKDKIYKLLYDKSVLCFGVRCINEDEWPIDDILSLYQNHIREEVEGMRKPELFGDPAPREERKYGFNEAIDAILEKFDDVKEIIK